MSTREEWAAHVALFPQHVDAAVAGIAKAADLATELRDVEAMLRSYEAGHQVRHDKRLARLASDLHKALTRFQKSRGESWRQSAVSS